MNRLPRIVALATAVLFCLAAAARADDFPTSGREGQPEARQDLGLRRPARHALLRHRLPRLARRLRPDRRHPDARHARPRVHLWDGTKYHAKVVAIEPDLDVALLKIKPGGDTDKIENLPYFRPGRGGEAAAGDVGTEVLAFSNYFKIATRDDPVSVQRAFVTAYAKLQGRNGVYEVPYDGEVYLVDAVTSNPGAAGGVLDDARRRADRRHRQRAAQHADRHLDELRRADRRRGRGDAAGRRRSSRRHGQPGHKGKYVKANANGAEGKGQPQLRRRWE